MVRAFEEGEDPLDPSTDDEGTIRWRDWLEVSGRLDRQLRAEAARLAHLRTPGERWGRPAAVINPLELLIWWEGRGGRRPLSLRELARKLGVSEATARRRLRTLTALELSLGGDALVDPWVLSALQAACSWQ